MLFAYPVDEDLPQSPAHTTCKLKAFAMMDTVYLSKEAQ